MESNIVVINVITKQTPKVTSKLTQCHNMMEKSMNAAIVITKQQLQHILKLTERHNMMESSMIVISVISNQDTNILCVGIKSQSMERNEINYEDDNFGNKNHCKRCGRKTTISLNLNM